MNQLRENVQDKSWTTSDLIQEIKDFIPSPGNEVTLADREDIYEEINNYIANNPDANANASWTTSDLNEIDNMQIPDLNRQTSDAYNNLKIAIEQTAPNHRKLHISGVSTDISPDTSPYISSMNSSIRNNYKRCKNGFARSRRTHRCRKNKVGRLQWIKSSLRKIKRYRKNCKRGSERHYTGRCIKKCKEGKTRKTTGSRRCVKN